MSSMPATWSISTPASPLSLDESRAEVLRTLAWTLMIACWALNVVHPLVAGSEAAVERVFLVTLWLMAVAGVSWALLRVGVAVAGTFLAGGLAVAVGALTIQNPDGPTIGLFALAVAAAAAAAGPRHGFGWAAIATAICLIASRGDLAILQPMALALVLVWGTALVFWIGFRPAYYAAEWAWSSYTEGLELSQQLRARQQELISLSKSLNEACDRLERQNIALERARAAAEEARRSKVEFAASISHELRTPLNLIIGFSEMMTVAPQSYGAERLPDTYRGDVEAIYRNAYHLSSLVDDVLDLSQVDAGRMGLHRDRVALAQIVGEAVSTVASLFRTKRLTLDIVLPEQPVILHVDRTRVRQVLINLLSNAARLTERGGVRVSARTDSSDLVVSVADTGPGIPEDELPRVFEEFHQVGIRNGQRGGHGLGLAICKRFVELHGGSIWLESTVGKGTTFHFSLPLRATTVISSSRPDWEAWGRIPEPRGDQDKALILVDSDGTSARTIPRYLDDYRVLVAESPERARDIAREIAPWGVIVAASSEGETSRQVDAAQARLGDLPIVAYTLLGRQITARELGVAEYLVKPVGADQISRALSGLGRRVRDLVIVEDDPEMLPLLARLVRSLPRRYRVREARNGLEGLALIREGRPDAVMLDLIMPEMDGYEVIREMHSDPELREIPIIVLTARGDTNESMVARSVSFTRSGGLSMRELTRCLTRGLEALEPAGLAPLARDSVPAQRGEPAE